MVTRKLARSFLIVMLLLSLPAFAVGANGHCSQATLDGTYAGIEQGTFVAAIVPSPPFPPPPVLFAAATSHTYDGAGNLSVRSTASIGGVILPFPAAGAVSGTGTYTVNPDCTYSEVITLTSGAVLHGTGTILREGILQETHKMWTVPGTVVSQTLKKIPTEGCTLGTLKGSYGLFGQGTIPGGLPAALSALFTADGDGNFSSAPEAAENVNSFAGAISMGTFTGTYSMNVNDIPCAISITVTPSTGPVVHEAGFISGVPPFQELHAIVTDPGFVLADVAKRQ